MLTPLLVNGIMGQPCTTRDCRDWRSIPAVVGAQLDAGRDSTEGEREDGRARLRPVGASAKVGATSCAAHHVVPSARSGGRKGVRIATRPDKEIDHLLPPPVDQGRDLPRAQIVESPAD